MNATRVLIVAGLGVCGAMLAAAASAAPRASTAQVRDVAFDVEPSAPGRASFAACAEVVKLLSQRGWDTAALSVRIQANPFDATSSSADLALDAGQPVETNAFMLAEALVERQLARTAEPAVARMLAETVAAHLSPPGSAARVQWERSWIQRLASGQLLTTALPEVLWRDGADAAIRRASRGPWPESALQALAALGIDNALHAVGEVAVAGILDPAVLGFQRPPLPEFAPAISQADTDVRLSTAGMRIVKLPPDATAVGIVPVQSEGVEAWVAVRYALTGAFDVVPLNGRTEVSVPMRGVVWAGVLVAALQPDASLSFAVRALPDYPVQIKRWDFVAGETDATLTWETQRHEGLQAFVVEALAATPTGAWNVLRRTVVPVAREGENPFGYTFVDEETKNTAAYRLLALTADGFLAEVGTFPLRGRPLP